MPFAVALFAAMPFFVSARSIILPPLPKWPDSKPLPVTYDEIMATIQRHTTVPCKFAAPSDAQLTAIPSSLLAPAVQWTIASLKAQGVGYTDNAFDCENFQRELCQTFAKIAARAGLKISAATGGISVVQKHAWGGVPAGGSHQPAVVQTEHGLFVVESQQPVLAACPIEAYPNRAFIFDVGGF